MIDDGIAKNCTAFDVNDVVALVSPVASAAGGHVLISMLGKSKLFAVTADIGSTILSELLGEFGFMDQDRVLSHTCLVLVGNENFSVQLVVLSGAIGGGILGQDNSIPSILHLTEASSGGQDLAVAPIRTAGGFPPSVTDLATWDEPSRGS